MIRRLVFLPKDFQKKYFSVSGSYFQDGDCDNSKAMERDKMDKSCLSVSLGFSVRFKFRVAIA